MRLARHPAPPCVRTQAGKALLMSRAVHWAPVARAAWAQNGKVSGWDGRGGLPTLVGALACRCGKADTWTKGGVFKWLWPRLEKAGCGRAGGIGAL